MQRKCKSMSYLTTKSSLIVSDLQITGEDLADAEEYAKNLTLEDVNRVCHLDDTLVARTDK
jgi:uncharacterized iron-regulated protein